MPSRTDDANQKLPVTVIAWKPWIESVVSPEIERTGKDLRTALSEKLDVDAMISYMKNDKKLPRIHREVVKCICYNTFLGSTPSVLSK